MNQELDDYFSCLPRARKDRFNLLHQTILKRYPEAVLDLKYKMPTYHVNDGWVALENQKNYISLYTCASSHIESFRVAHPDIKTGKGCINFRDKDDIPIEEVVQVIEHAIEHPKGLE